MKSNKNGENTQIENAKILLSTDDGKTVKELKIDTDYTAQKSTQLQHGYWTKYTIPLSGEDYAGKNVRIGIKKLATATPVTVDCFYMYKKAELKANNT